MWTLLRSQWKRDGLFAWGCPRGRARGKGNAIFKRDRKRLAANPGRRMTQKRVISRWRGTFVDSDPKPSSVSRTWGSNFPVLQGVQSFSSFFQRTHIHFWPPCRPSLTVFRLDSLAFNKPRLWFSHGKMFFLFHWRVNMTRFLTTAPPLFTHLLLKTFSTEMRQWLLCHWPLMHN